VTSDAKDLEYMAADAEAVYDAEIFPLMNQIIDICKRHKIPMLCTFQYCDDTRPDNAGFCTSAIPFRGMSARLKFATEVMVKGTVGQDGRPM